MLFARWSERVVTREETALIEDAAHSLRLALEREEAALAHQDAAALRRSREFQRDFLSRLSHELRTPLTAIRGYASSLMAPDVSWDAESQRRFLETIATESARLGRLVEDLLDFSAIESGVMRLTRDWCDLALVADAAVSCLPPEQAAAVEVLCSDELPPVFADHDRLEQVLLNLLSNAIRHNPPGTHVTLSVAPVLRTPCRSASATTGWGSPRNWRTRRSIRPGSTARAAPGRGWASRSRAASSRRMAVRSSWWRRRPARASASGCPSSPTTPSIPQSAPI